MLLRLDGDNFHCWLLHYLFGYLTEVVWRGDFAGDEIADALCDRALTLCAAAD